jgi:phage portal protein BeeE
MGGALTVQTIPQLWPPQIPGRGTIGRQVWNAAGVRRIPAVGRALGIYGLIACMPMDVYSGVRPQPRPRLLDQPDLSDDGGAAAFIRSHVSDYLLHGNACHYVTSYGADGYPLTCRWFPAERWTILADELGQDREYYLNGKPVPRARVVHVKRGADPWQPARGVGVVESYLATFDKAARQDYYETSLLGDAGVPSVAIIAPNERITQEDADAAGSAWDDAFAGGRRVPGLFPKGTQVVPLGWSPSDQELTEARKMSLTDVANAFDLDGYWLGAPSSSHTYRSVGPMFLALLRTSLLPVVTDLETVWSNRWLPRGRRIRMDTTKITADDLSTAVSTAARAVGAQLWAESEARVYLGMDPDKPGPPTPPAPPPAPADDNPGPDPIPEHESEQ